MDCPLVSFELREKYLLVIGHGKREHLSEMVEASTLIYQKIEETNSRFLLVDYRALEINLHLNEAFNIVKRYESAQPGLKEIIIAAVFERRGLNFGSYWKEVAGRRGFFIEVFEDIRQAEIWLEAQISR